MSEENNSELFNNEEIIKEYRGVSVEKIIINDCSYKIGDKGKLWIINI